MGHLLCISKAAKNQPFRVGGRAMAFAGDKAATVFELVRDIRHKSSQHVLSRMGRTAEQLLWYYGTVQSMLSRRVTESMADFFASQVSDLRNALRVN